MEIVRATDERVSFARKSEKVNQTSSFLRPWHSNNRIGLWNQLARESQEGRCHLKIFSWLKSMKSSVMCLMQNTKVLLPTKLKKKLGKIYMDNTMHDFQTLKDLWKISSPDLRNWSRAIFSRNTRSQELPLVEEDSLRVPILLNRKSWISAKALLISKV